ncbi:Mismatch repair endonuclease pms2 [Rhizopus azygosporus]|uniref:DNA mismatch repair protein PMS1 n=1 Tax=Rhizopus azygosporus TaxID=86630 RepID=A0A367K5C4_RHIAZ|nr:Mismatch repair endonuclease pms2 [Rhizopus azygosporus]
MIISAIDKQSVHRICSGQVVLDLATAVKELVENSIDAGASCIDIKFKDYGVEGIEVSDDGSGIDPVNYETLALKHYTSKISQFEDLEKVATFGFRGEAISSLCALSQLIVITATKEQAPMGMKLEYDDNGKLKSKTPIARSTGTTVQLTNIFHSLPVRQKEFKRNCKKEYGKALAILQAYSIISCNIKISVFNQSGNKPSTKVMSTNKNRDMRDNMSNIFGSKIVSQITPFEISLESLLGQGSVEGFISRPEWGLGRSSSDRQYFYVNGRPCILPKMAKALNEIYRSFITNQYPFIVANFKIPTDVYDVNVSPDKRTIFIHEENKIAEIIMEQLKGFLEPSRSTFQTNDLTTTEEETVTTTTMPKVSLQSFALASGSHYRPKSMYDTNLGKRNYTKTTTSSETGNIKDYLLKKPRLDDEEVDELTEEYDNQSDKPPIMGNNDILQASEISSVASISSISEAVTEPDVIAIDTAQRKVSEITLINDMTQPMAVDIQEEQSATDSCQHFEQHKDIRSYEGHWKTNGRSMTVTIKDFVNIPIKEQTAPIDNRSDDFLIDASIQNVQDNNKATEALNRVIHKSDFARMKVLGQFNLGFVIASLDDQDLYIIDQHASDEKYNFETLQKTVRVDSQKLIRQVPQILDLSAAEELVVMDHLDVFKANGFDIEVLPDNEPTKRIRVLSQPVTKRAMLDKKDISEIIHLLSEHPDEMVRCSRNRAIFASMACHKAVRIGQSLTKNKMTTIIRHMGEIDQPWNCPHGRPTMRHLLSLSQLKQTRKREFSFKGTMFC